MLNLFGSCRWLWLTTENMIVLHGWMWPLLHEEKIAAVDKLQQISGTNNTRHIVCRCRHNNQMIRIKIQTKWSMTLLTLCPWRETCTCSLYLEFYIMQYCTAVPTATDSYDIYNLWHVMTKHYEMHSREHKKYNSSFQNFTNECFSWYQVHYKGKLEICHSVSSNFTAE